MGLDELVGYDGVFGRFRQLKGGTNSSMTANTKKKNTALERVGLLIKAM